MGWNAAGILHQAGRLLGRQNEILAVERQAELPDGGLLIFYLNVQILAPQDFIGKLQDVQEFLWREPVVVVAGFP